MIIFLNSLDRDLFESGHRIFVGFFLDFILNFEILKVLKTYGPVLVTGLCPFIDLGGSAIDGEGMTL